MQTACVQFLKGSYLNQFLAKIGAGGSFSAPLQELLWNSVKLHQKGPESYLIDACTVLFPYSAPTFNLENELCVKLLSHASYTETGKGKRDTCTTRVCSAALWHSISQDFFPYPLGIFSKTTSIALFCKIIDLEKS